MARQLGGNWTSGLTEFDGQPYRWQALVFRQGSQYGIDGGRVSKLAITDDPTTWAHPVYNWDRGEDVDIAPAGLLAQVLAEIGD